MVGVDLADGLPKIEPECCMWSVTQLCALVITDASCLHSPMKSIKPHAIIVIIVQQKLTKCLLSCLAFNLQG